MKDPYQILGISSYATEDEINRAYREKAKLFQNDDAKMQELNDAYDAAITRIRNGGAQGGYTGSSDFSDIRAKLLAGRIDDAEMLLDGIPENVRNAEWNFLKGTVLYKRGWLEEAYRHYTIATQMDPGNQEYRAALNNLASTRSGQYRTTQTQSSGCSACDVCSGLICADCCCECMGGDLIRCC